MKDITPIIESLTREKYDLIIAGDFNTNLLKLNTRNKYAEYLDVMLCNGLFPKITLPTRVAERSATLIDNIFRSVSNSSKSCTSDIIFSDISDHLPCFTCIDTQRSTQSTPRYVKTYTNDTVSMQNFYAELNGLNILEQLNLDSNCNPNENYAKLENIITQVKEKHLPTKMVKFNKYKHKKCPWVTNGILNSIQYRDSFYK